jgi:hypothetical protein
MDFQALLPISCAYFFCSTDGQISRQQEEAEEEKDESETLNGVGFFLEDTRRLTLPTLFPADGNSPHSRRCP